MHDQDEAHFETVDLPDGVRLVLPPRQLGLLRQIGHVLLLVGVGVLLVAVAVVGKRLAAGDDWMVALPRGFFGLFGAMAIGVGAAMARSRCIVELRPGRLRLIEQLGLVRKSWTRSLDQLTALNVHRAALKVNQVPVRSGVWSDIASIRAQFEGQTMLALAAMYPFATAMAVAQALARHIDLMQPDRIMGRARLRVEVVDEVAGDDVAPADEEMARGAVVARDAEPIVWPSPPPETKVGFALNEDGVSLRVPPVGFFGAPAVRASVIFTIVWLVFIGGFTVFAVIGVVGGGNKQGWLFPLFTLPFWAAGIGMAIYDVHLAKREAILDVIGGTLLVTHKGLRGVKQHEWQQGQVKAIRCGPSGTSVNDKPLMQLQIEPHEGKPTRLLTGRDEAELRWMAQVLRLALQQAGR